MSNYNTGNPVPSIDPRDLDDNATVFDLLLSSTATSVADRKGKARKTWHQMEIDAEALLSPNVAALAGLTGAANKGFAFTGFGAMSTYTLTAYGKSFLAVVDQPAARSYLGLGSAAIADLGAASGAAELTAGSKLVTSQYQTPLAALAALTPAADRLPYFNGASTAALATIATYGRDFLASADMATAQVYLGIGSNTFTNFALQNSWTVMSSRRAAYRKVLDMVQIEMHILGGTATDTTLLATLPVGFRPASECVVPVMSGPNATPSSSVGIPRVIIHTDGTITCMNCSSGPGITFVATLSTV